jgi:aminoglycoside 6'-N-acetyltransferase I
MAATVEARAQALRSGEPLMSDSVNVRLGVPADTGAIARQFHALWPDGPLSEHALEARLILDGQPPSTMPLVVFVAEMGAEVVGFVEVGLRSHADGCDSRSPVWFIEGWYVEPGSRRRGIGRALLKSAEDWARSHGCSEMASDMWTDNEPSQRAHEAMGFEVVDRCVHYRKSLR